MRTMFTYWMNVPIFKYEDNVHLLNECANIQIKEFLMPFHSIGSTIQYILLQTVTISRWACEKDALKNWICIYIILDKLFDQIEYKF